MSFGASSLNRTDNVGAHASAGAAYLIYENWEPIAAFFGKLWDNVVGRFHSATETIRGGLSSVTDIVPRGVENFFGFGGDDSPPGRKALPDGPAGGRLTRTEVGGLLKVQIESDRPVRVRELRADNPDVGIQVDTGLVMAGG